MFAKNIRFFRVLKISATPLLTLPLFGLSAASQTVQPSTAAVHIERILFSGNRTTEKIMRRHLPFSEGDALGPDSLKDARTALWDMRQFKKVEVSSSSLSDGAAEIRVAVEDGWYLLPLPFITGGSGGGRGGLVLLGGNIFRRTESIMASAFSSSAGSSAVLALRKEKWSLNASVRRLDFIERRYSDGAFSAASGFGSPPDERNPSKYGTVSDSYRREEAETTVAMGLPLTGGSGRGDGLSAAFGWERSRLKYPAYPMGADLDSGRQGQVFVSIKSGKGGGGAAEAFGAIFGFGLADMERRLKPLPSPIFSSGAGVSYHRGAVWTGSDFSYGYLLANWEGVMTWGTHRSLALRLAGGRGKDLPSGRRLVTGHETALSGNYAREFRGDSAAGAGLTYSHTFRVTRRGMWQGALFVETARAWEGAASGTKSGAGASFWYKFWRFPLPLGFSCTYSFDDRDPQLSAALGGRF